MPLEVVHDRCVMVLSGRVHDALCLDGRLEWLGIMMINVFICVFIVLLFSFFFISIISFLFCFYHSCYYISIIVLLFMFCYFIQCVMFFGLRFCCLEFYCMIDVITLFDGFVMWLFSLCCLCFITLFLHPVISFIMLFILFYCAKYVLITLFTFLYQNTYPHNHTCVLRSKYACKLIHGILTRYRIWKLWHC